MALRATQVCDLVRRGIVMRRSILYRPFVPWAIQKLQVFQELIDPIGGSWVVVRTAGLEPAQGFPQGILRLFPAVYHGYPQFKTDAGSYCAAGIY